MFLILKILVISVFDFLNLNLFILVSIFKKKLSLVTDFGNLNAQFVEVFHYNKD